MSGWQTNQLIELIQRRYPDWESFEHPQYLTDEIKSKKKLVEKASHFLAQEPLDKLINAGQFDEILTNLNRLTRQTNLLWRRVPSSGDTAVLESSNLDKAQFCIKIRNLLHGDRSSGERLQTFSEYLEGASLPNKWPFVTFLMYVVHPQTDLIIKSRSANWFLQFMGINHPLDKIPNGDAYERLQQLALDLLERLKGYGAVDMLDVQSAIWIGMRESKKSVGSLDHKSQVFLDIPPTPPMNTLATAEPVLKENNTAGYQTPSPYSLGTMIQETGLMKEEIDRWLKVLERKKQLMFYGPPGTGKTFYAEKLGKLIAHKTSGIYETIQFHPAYSYEDFLEGLRPLTQNGQVVFQKVAGQFLKFCQKAEQYKGTCILIIDEINRANLPSVFGELMHLLEYRDKSMTLASGTSFKIPANVRLIATMNSADRSLALVDFALRRRFAFLHLPPRYELLNHYHTESKVNLNDLIKSLKAINDLIGDSNYAIGHSYFLLPDLHLHLKNIWELEIIPYLHEYFIGAPEQIAQFSWESVQDRMIG
ncbi:MAG: AAA family ATPase [Chloroflexota bacterium]